MKKIVFCSLVILAFILMIFPVNAQNSETVGYWKFDEGSGNVAYDSSGNSLTGFISGTTWVDGISGNALNFSNVDDYFTIPANNKLTFSNGNFTVEGWFKLSEKHQAGSSNKWILLKNGEYGIYLNGNNGYLQFYFSDSYQYSTKNSWDANTWYHVAGVHDSNDNWKIYINGVLDTSGSKSYFTTATCSFDIGNFLGCQTPHDNFVGAIDEVKLFSRPLSASDILAEYQYFANSNPLTTSGDSSTVSMSSGQTFTLTLTITNNNANAIINSYSLNLPTGYSATGDPQTSSGTSFAVGTTTLTWTITTGSSSGTITFQLGNNTDVFSKSVTITSSSSGSTWCTNWINVGCRISPCSSNQMKQTQKCGYSNSSGYSSEWENSQCVANETCVIQKIINIPSAKCTNTTPTNNIIDFTVQNVGDNNINAGELLAYIDGSLNYYIDELPNINEAGLSVGEVKEFNLKTSNFADVRTLKVVSPSFTIEKILTCEIETNSCSYDSDCTNKIDKIVCPAVVGSDTPRCINSSCICGAKPTCSTALLELTYYTCIDGYIKVVVENIGKTDLTDFSIFANINGNILSTPGKYQTVLTPGRLGTLMFFAENYTGPISKIRISAGNCPDMYIEITNDTKAIGTCTASACAQVITPAKNPATNECKKFSSPCDVPSGWIKVSDCPENQKVCKYAMIDAKKSDVSYNFQGALSTVNITVFNNGDESLYNFTFIIKTNSNIYSFVPTNQYTKASPFEPSNTVLLLGVNQISAPSSSEIFKELKIRALCRDDYAITHKIDMQTPQQSSSETTVSKIKEIDKTVLLDVIFSLEHVKIKLDNLKESALAISEYYTEKGEIVKADKWFEISNTFNNAINGIDDITNEIKQNKDNITTEFIQRIKIKVAGVKAEISFIVDKIIEVV